MNYKLRRRTYDSVGTLPLVSKPAGETKALWTADTKDIEDAFLVGTLFVTTPQNGKLGCWRPNVRRSKRTPSFKSIQALIHDDNFEYF
jgi:hypothetical protein